MARIQVLSQSVADKIAAGEVAERPSAVVKELVENAVDAGADKITVEIKRGGIEYISVSDNGKGIAADEIETAFLRHATSKLRSVDDLFKISTMGFRGEALASICAVSETEVLSRTEDSEEGTYMELEHGKAVKRETVACNRGTTMIVKKLFANVPARMKFLRKDSTEAGYVTDVMGRIAMSKPHIAFRYICDGKEVFSTSGDGKLKNVILNIYGIEFAKSIYDVDYEEHGVHVYGAAGKAETARGNRTRQTLFVNGRYIKNHVVSKVVEEAYRNVIMTGKFPFFVLNIDLSAELVDVNVHPAKTEIKFANEQEIYNTVNRAVKNAIYGGHGTPKPAQSTAQSYKSAGGNAAINGVALEDKYREKLKKCVEERPTDASLVLEYIRQIEKTEGRSKLMKFNEPQSAEEDVEELAKRLRREREGAVIDVFDTKDETRSGSTVISSEPADGSNMQKPIFKDDNYFSAVNIGENTDDNSVKSEKVGEIDKIKETEKSDKIEQDAEPDVIAVPSKEMRAVGQIFDTYIVAECDNEMCLIDQHAAHERKRFEALKESYAKREISGQILLVPIVFDASPAELRALKDNSELLQAMGIKTEEFGRSAVLITETPIVADERTIKDMVGELAEILHEGRPSGLLSFEERLLDTVSCKYAIKANKRLSDREITALLKDVEELEAQGITTCPHGRPIKVAFTKRELEKMFKRIV